ncbi:alpha/beta hydrolase [Streptomyces sp. NPDC090022]|uniref:alpha/beta hydrolase n=1 Tax=Streptomyces sp. NPDC090022 TaxID=3365920 RepID=UPI003805E936
MHRSRVATAAGCLALVVAAAGPASAGPARGTEPAVATPAPAATPTPAGIRWGSCERVRPDAPAALRCGTLTVPLDHADPARGTLDIAVARLPATGGKRLGSLVMNFGGPGASGIESLTTDHTLFADLGEAYDLVAFDPRGVGHSRPVSCGPRPDNGDGGAEDDAVSRLADLRAQAQRCARHSGPVLPYIGTVHVARDLDLLRRALGEDKLDYLGFSYGTRLGAVYAAQYPRHVGRMVLDGVDTLTAPLTEQALTTAQSQQRALDHFLTWCAHRPGCVYGTNTRTAKEKVTDLVARLNRKPLVGNGTYLTGSDLVGVIADALYSPEVWPALAEGLARAERDDDPTALMELAEPERDDGTDGPYDVPPDNAEAALVAVNCADDPDRGEEKARPEVVAREVEALRPEFERASEIFGPYQLRTVLACYGRPAGTDHIRRIDRPAGSPRLLLVGTRGDPATPYRWTEETARRLGPAAVVLDYKGDGHGAYYHARCVRERVDAFLTGGRLPGGTMSCPAEHAERAERADTG